jgi:hypothetical protein
LQLSDARVIKRRDAEQPGCQHEFGHADTRAVLQMHVSQAPVFAFRSGEQLVAGSSPQWAAPETESHHAESNQAHHQERHRLAP